MVHRVIYFLVLKVIIVQNLINFVKRLVQLKFNLSDKFIYSFVGKLSRLYLNDPPL